VIIVALKIDILEAPVSWDKWLCWTQVLFGCPEVFGVSTHIVWCLFLLAMDPISCYFLCNFKTFGLLGKVECRYCWWNSRTHVI